jgi:phosphatidylinositol alpha-1,6-mannosyltransferase
LDQARQSMEMASAHDTSRGPVDLAHRMAVSGLSSLPNRMIQARAGGRQRILLVTRNLPPLRGGMERLNLHMAFELAREFDVVVIGPHGCQSVLGADFTVYEVSGKPLWRFFFGAAWASLRAAFHWRPHAVLAGSGLTAPFAWLAAKSAGAQMVVYAHGLDLIASHPIFHWFWRPFIRRADVCMVNSFNTASLAHSIGVPAARTVILHPGVTLPHDNDARDFRERFGLDNRPLLLSVGRLIARKGLLEFVQNALPDIVRHTQDVCLVVLGDEAPELLQGNSSGLGERIRQCATTLGLARNLRFIGPQDDATLASAYAAADVHVFPVRDTPGDVEGFGMVAVEAAAYGLPTVAFAVGGVPDAVADGVSGDLVEPGNYSEMARRIVARLSDTTGRTQSGLKAREFARRFTWDEFGNRARDLFRSLCRQDARG